MALQNAQQILFLYQVFVVAVRIYAPSILTNNATISASIGYRENAFQIR